MSYRTYVNDVQVFGNNEYYPEWIDFLKTQNVVFDEDNESYEGYITDFMGALTTIETITLRLEKDYQENHESTSNHNSLYDLSNISHGLNNDNSIESLFDKLFYAIQYGYGFMPYTFYIACKEKIIYSNEKTPHHLRSYKLKDGETISVSAG